ncbi:MAG: EthD domain-containing protein [Chromatiales bacterium]|jgi:hypothetical protein|nr:EthD domain-containing protein [Chromatiales bacterium]
MIRVTFLLRRRADLSREAFQDYWLHKHGLLIAGSSNALNAVRYVQVHTLDDDLNPKLAKVRSAHMEAPYDGVAELWWEDEDALNASTRTQAGREAGAALLEDEHNFLDIQNSSVYFGYEYPQVNPSPETIVARPDSSIVKLYFPLRHQATLSQDEAQRYWHRQHGPLIRSQARAAGILRYLQVHRVEHPLEAVFRNVRGITSEPYTGHAELWVDRQSFLTATPAAKAAGAAAISDEGRFIDFDRSSIWLAKEHVLHGKNET